MCNRLIKPNCEVEFENEDHEWRKVEDERDV